MGVYGCGWVRWVAGGTGDAKTRQAGGFYGRAGQDLGPMAGEISPDIMFWAVWRKRSKMGKYGCKSVRMGAIGCADTGRSKNKITNSKKQASRTWFWILVHRGQMQEVSRDGHGGLEGTMWRNRGERRGARCDIDDYMQGGQKKTNNDTKQNEHESTQIFLTR